MSVARRASWWALALVTATLTACGGGEDAAKEPAGGGSPADAPRTASSTDGAPPAPRFDPDNLPADAALDATRRGPAFDSDREAVAAFKAAYRAVDLDRMQEVWWRMNAVQRFAAHEAGHALSDEASMSDYQRMLPSQYLLEAENRAALEAAAAREARGESPDPPAVATFEMPAAPEPERGTIRGVLVVEGSGEPVAGVELAASPRGPAALAYLTGQAESLGAVTASDGTFEITGVPAGKVSLVGQKLPHYPMIGHQTTVTANETVEVRIEVKPVGKLQLELPVVVAGVVRDELTGEPVPGVQVSAGRRGGARTDERGRYNIFDTGLGEITLDTEHPDFHPTTSTFVAEENGKIERDLSIRPITTGVVEGLVVDRVSGLPLAGATVAVGDQTVTTDDDGRFRFEPLEAGELALSGSAARYRGAVDRLRLERRATAEVRIELDPITEGTVLGIVTNAATGRPLAGARVQIGPLAVESGADGRFEIADVPAGRANLVAEKAVYESAAESVEVIAAESVELALALEPITHGTVTVEVADAASGAPLADSEVRLGSGLVARTDRAGRARFEDVDAGEINVGASKAVYEPASKSVDVVAAGSVSVELELEPITYGSVTGTVVDASTNRPLDGVRVTAGDRATETDARGRFTLERVAAGELRLSATRPVYESASESVRLEPAAAIERRLALQPITYGRLTGRVVDAESGRPLAGAEVSVGSHRLTSGADGGFEIERLDAGGVTVTASKTAYRPGSASLTLAPAASAEALVELEPIKVGEVIGVVRDARTGEPIAGARVAVGGREVETDAAGRFSLAEIDIGRIGVSARHADYGDGAVNGQLDGGGTLDLEIRLDLRREDVTELESALASKGTIDLYGIHFDSGEDRFKPSSLGTLNAVLQVIKRAPERRFRIAGHTDSDGTDAHNQDLSERRARTVIDWLVEKGIEPQRLELAGYGESRPAATNDTPSGKALNRRVELGYVR